MRMKKTDYTFDSLHNVVASETSFAALMDMVNDLGLEIMSIRTA